MRIFDMLKLTLRAAWVGCALAVLLVALPASAGSVSIGGMDYNWLETDPYSSTFAHLSGSTAIDGSNFSVTVNEGTRTDGVMCTMPHFSRFPII